MPKACAGSKSRRFWVERADRVRQQRAAGAQQLGGTAAGRAEVWAVRQGQAGVVPTWVRKVMGLSEAQTKRLIRRIWITGKCNPSHTSGTRSRRSTASKTWRDCTNHRAPFLVFQFVYRFNAWQLLLWV